eukprot:927924_1
MDNKNEPLKKKQKRDIKCNIGCDPVKRKCNECGKVCKTRSGLGTHKWKAHKISGNSKISIKRKCKKIKKMNESINNKNNVIVISDSNSDNSEHDDDVVVMVKKKSKGGMRKCEKEVPKLLKMLNKKKKKKVSGDVKVRMDKSKCVGDVSCIDGDGDGTFDSNYHEYESIFTCDECGEEFVDRNKLEKHIRHEH